MRRWPSAARGRSPCPSRTSTSTATPPRPSARSTSCSPAASASSRSAEALRPAQARRGEGADAQGAGPLLREIGESLGWTYTKVNRCITEGRARFLKVFAEIEAGEECERFAPTLAALVGGTATADALLELRPHLRTARPAARPSASLHESASVASRRSGRFRRSSRRCAGSRAVSAHPPSPTTRAPQLERATDGRRTRIVLVAGGRHPGSARSGSPHRAARPAELVRARTTLRAQGPPLPVVAPPSGQRRRDHRPDRRRERGGGRIATIGAIIGLCLSGVGAGTVCVVSGVVHNPFSARRLSGPSPTRDTRPSATPRLAQRRRPPPRPWSQRRSRHRRPNPRRDPRPRPAIAAAATKRHRDQPRLPRAGPARRRTSHGDAGFRIRTGRPGAHNPLPLQRRQPAEVNSHRENSRTRDLDDLLGPRRSYPIRRCGLVLRPRLPRRRAELHVDRVSDLRHHCVHPMSSWRRDRGGPLRAERLWYQPSRRL